MLTVRLLCKRKKGTIARTFRLFLFGGVQEISAPAAGMCSKHHVKLKKLSEALVGKVSRLLSG